MKSTILFKKWDIILVPFPFTDLSSVKRRPFLVISPDDFNIKEDIVIAFITSNIPALIRSNDFKIN